MAPTLFLNQVMSAFTQILHLIHTACTAHFLTGKVLLSKNEYIMNGMRTHTDLPHKAILRNQSLILPIKSQAARLLFFGGREKSLICYAHCETSTRVSMAAM